MAHQFELCPVFKCNNKLKYFAGEIMYTTCSTHKHLCGMKNCGRLTTSRHKVCDMCYCNSECARLGCNVKGNERWERCRFLGFWKYCSKSCAKRCS